MSDEVRPFDSGTQYGAWTARNCRHCAKYNPDKYDGMCEIDGALGGAYLRHGFVSVEIAERMAFRGPVPGNLGPWTWDCPEIEPRIAATPDAPSADRAGRERVEGRKD